jgi:hypothetical protein
MEKDKGQKPEYMMIYLYSTCGMDSAFTETEKPVCRYCDEPAGMKLIPKEKASPVFIEKRLKALTHCMPANFQAAFSSMPREVHQSLLFSVVRISFRISSSLIAGFAP